MSADFARLAAFAAVAETRGFRAAGERLGVVQDASNPGEYAASALRGRISSSGVAMALLVGECSWRRNQQSPIS